MDDSSSYGKIITTEQRRQGRIGADQYMQYLKSMKGWYFALPFILFFLIFANLKDSGFRYLASLWADGFPQKNSTQETHFFGKIYSYLAQLSDEHVVLLFLIFCLVAILVTSLNWLIMIGFLTNGARILHNEMVEGFSHVRITFFDENPTGRLVRRFSSDYAQIKDEIPNLLTDILGSVFELLLVVGIVLFQAPLAALAVLPCFLFYYHIQSCFKPAAREMQRYTKVLETPMWSLFGETVQGYQTIRAFNRSAVFVNRLKNLGITYGKASFLQSRFTRWLNLRLKLTSEFFTLVMTIIVSYLVATKGLSVGRAGFLMSLGIGLDATMQWLTRSISLMESKMVATERVIEYKNLPPEEDPHKKFLDPPSLWPSLGSITFDHYTASYRPDLPLILNDLAFTITGGQKIGIIGRTGAGKSTLFQALFRMVHVHLGRILVDGIDINQISVEKTRSLFAIVPQEPHLFSGPIGFNLDRTGRFSEEELWKALEEVQLAEHVRSLPGGLGFSLEERGVNFSVGQRQLLCMARAILMQSKIVLVDEATASVDKATDDFMQQAMAKSFENRTVLIIAHRLETLKNVDQVLVLSQGRALEMGPPQAILKKYGLKIEQELV